MQSKALRDMQKEQTPEYLEFVEKIQNEAICTFIRNLRRSGFALGLVINSKNGNRLGELERMLEGQINLTPETLECLSSYAKNLDGLVSPDLECYLMFGGNRPEPEFKNDSAVLS